MKKNNMEEENHIEDPKMSVASKFWWSLFALFLTISLILGAIKIFRNNSPSELSQRFVRNNEIIQEKSGGISNITSFKNGKKSGNSWELTGTVYGKDNNLEVTVYLVCGDGMSDSGSTCGVIGAKYRNKNGIVKDLNDSDWHEIEVGWCEDFFLTFKR